MKKRIIFLSIATILLLCGCSNLGKKDMMGNLIKKVNSTKTYQMSATLDIYRNEEIYTYNVESSYKKDDCFKVSLTNKNNEHEQIILKNEEGVYVLTPSLNKSFKFQSDWPYNNSQIYLLQPIIIDIENDTESKLESKDDGYIITSKVNYSTEKDFKKQKVYLDKDGNMTKVEVVDNDNNVKMSLKITNIDYNAKFDDDYFNSETYNIEENNEEESDKTKTESSDEQSSTNQETDNDVAKIEEVIYPMYVPVETYLTEQNVVDTGTGERAILTFSGETPFTIIQETVEQNDLIDYVYGDPYIILDTVGSLADGTISWISNGVEYSIMSDNMELDELLTVAQSISVTAVSK